MNNLLFQLSVFSSSIALKPARSIVGTTYSSLYGIKSNLYFNSSLKSAIKSINLCYSSSSSSSLLSRFSVVRCFSSQRKRKSAMKKNVDAKEGEYFVVRKGDIVGVYKTFAECQAQVGSSITDPPASVYKGYSFPEDALEYLTSRGLQNALYTIKASDLKDDLFGTLFPCPFQEPSSTKGETSNIVLPEKRPYDMLESGNENSCIIHFDGASKGNPGPAGAGVVLRTPNGGLICRIREGLGVATNNVAEYRAVILGLKKALEMGYTSVKAMGDSRLVCMQLQGLWKVRNQNMSDLCDEATKLKDQLSSFQIAHILRELNSDADAQANFGVSLADGQVEEIFH